MNAKDESIKKNLPRTTTKKPKVTKLPAPPKPKGEDNFKPFEIDKFKEEKNPERVKFLEDKINIQSKKKDSITKSKSPKKMATKESVKEESATGVTKGEDLKVIAKRRAKTCCCRSWIFFSEFEYLFMIGNQRPLKKQDMAPLPPGIRSDKVKNIALGIWKEMDEKAENEEVSLQNKFSDKGEVDNGKKSKKVKDIFTVIYKMIRPKLTMAIILKAIENIIILALSFLLRTFVPQVKKSEEERDHVIIFICPVIAGILGFIRYMLKEHGAKFVCQSGSMAGQTMRSLLFHKIVNSNLSFLRNADDSIVTKIVLFDLDIILGYLSKLPDLFSFPIIFILSNAMMVYFISFTTLITFVVFIVAWLILIFVTKKLSIENNKYKYYGSKRATVVSEVISKMKTIKSNSLEMFLEQRLSILRDREMACLISVNNYRAVANLIMSLTPFFSILIILLLERNLRGVQLDVTTTFTIVSIIASLNKPLRRFVNILDRYYDYCQAKQSLNNLLFLIPERPNHALNDKELKTGWIEFTNCDVSLEIDKSMKENLKKIFGTDQDVERELRRYKEMAMARNSYIYRTSKTRKKEEKQKTADLDLSQSTYEEEDTTVMKKQLFRNVNVTIFPKTKIGVTGESAATDFLFTILGETYVDRGMVKYRGKVVYQDEDDSSFLENCSIRDNILMGDVMIKDRYQKVLKCVGLNLNNFPGGDQIEILTDAKNLSGSEKRKLLMARMLYVSGDIYILEDFFGHDDEESERMLFKRIIDGMLKAKTVLVKTDSEVILSQTDKILFFKNGSCKQFNNYQDYQDFLQGKTKVHNSQKKKSMSNRLSKLGFKNLGGNKSNRDNINTEEVDLFGKSAFSNIKKRQEKNILNVLQDRNNNDKRFEDLGEGFFILSSLMPGILRIIKKKSEGRQIESWNEGPVYKQNFAKSVSNYAFLIGKFRILIQIFLFVLSGALFVAIDLWTGTWSNDLLGWTMNSYIAVYLSISISFSLMVLIRDVIFHRTLAGNAKHVQLLMVKSLLNINLQWMDLYPDSRIDFKLSYDVKKIDQSLNTQIHALIESLVYVVAAGIILNYIYFGFILLTMIVFGVYLYFVMRNYFRTVRSLIEFISENTASLKNVMNQTINEAVQYRVLGTKKILESRFSSLTNEMQRAMTHYGFYCGRWIGVRLGWVYTGLIITAYCVPIFFKFSLDEVTDLTLLEIALAISWSLKFVGFFDTMIKATMRIHKNIVSFGRIEHFVKKVKAEPTNRRPIYAKQDKEQVVLEMQDVDKSFGARKVLSDIKIKINKLEKIAVVGSSGSGKHVLMNLIMQIYFKDTEDANGMKKKSALEVLGIDVDKSNPRNIRHNIRYLSRLPITFSGTIRENIDPAYKYKNSEIYSVMDILNAGEILIDKATREAGEVLNNIQFGSRDSEDRKKTSMNTFKGSPTAGARHGRERRPISFQNISGEIKEETDENEEEKSPETPNKIDIMFRDNGERLDTISSSKPLLTDGNDMNLDTLPNEGKNEEDSRKAYEMNLKDNKKKLKQDFLNKELGDKIGEYPIRLRKLLKAIKVLLDKPQILIIDQKALDFDNTKNFGEILKILTDNLKNTTFFVVMNSFEHVLDCNRALVMNRGKVVELENVGSLLIDSESRFNYLVKKADLGIYKKLKRKILNENGNSSARNRGSVVTETPTMISMFNKVNEHSFLGEDSINGKQTGFNKRAPGQQWPAEDVKVNRIRNFSVNDNMNRMKTIRSRGGEEQYSGVKNQDILDKFNSGGG